MKKINIGMTKNKVVEILGNQYKRSGGDVLDDQIIVEKITYFDLDGLEYEFTFKNDQLSKWENIRYHNKHLHKKDSE